MATAKTDQAGGGRAVVDAHDAVLLYAFEAGPYLIKPNRHELEFLVDRQLANIEALATQARELQRQGAPVVPVPSSDWVPSVLKYRRNSCLPVNFSSVVC